VRRVLLLLLCMCGPHDAESAFFDGPRPPPRGVPCSDNSECQADEFCEKHTCDALSGNCESRTMCTPRGGAVCGCDDVKYGNDCLRRAAGISGFTPLDSTGQCQ
jgi:hypothetical protein